jgi:cytochrome c-type biogenesis protein CcmH/NrfG
MGGRLDEVPRVSRLYDRLAGLDRGRARPLGMGAISIPAPPRALRGSWRLVGYLVILLGMVAVLVAVSVFPLKSAAIPVAPLSPAPPVLDAEAPVEPPRAAVSPLLAQGLEAAQRGELADAEGYFRRAVEQDAGDAEAWNSLGVVLVRQGEHAQGVEALRKALRLQPSHIEAHRNLGVALDRLGRAGEAARHYRTFLSLTTDAHPGRGDVRRRLLELGSVRTGV